MKRIVLIGIAILVVLIFVSCSGGNRQTEKQDSNIPRTTNNPTEKVTEAPTDVPTAPPTQAPTEQPTQEPTELVTEEPSLTQKEVVYSAYADILSEKNAGRFKLIYIDGDEIAELAYFEGNGAHADQVELFTYYDGEVVNLGKVGAYGTIAFSEYNNRVFGYTGLQPNAELEAKYTYKIENGELVNGYDGLNYDISTAFVDDGIKNDDYNRSMLAVDGL